MKYLLIVIILSTSTALAQNADSSRILIKHKSINEISYQMPLAFGYSHVWNINSNFLFGTGFHLGYCLYLPPYSDFFLYKVYTRNLFNNVKLNHRFEYDIGLFTSLSFKYESIFYGITTSGYLNLWKFSVGINLLTGAANSEGEFYFPRLVFTPVLLFKF
jgi:hypothetical protein